MKSTTTIYANFYKIVFDKSEQTVTFNNTKKKLRNAYYKIQNL